MFARISRISCRYSSTTANGHNYYEIFELPPSASIKQIKKQFKILSKKYHPDLNSHLGEEEKKANNDRFVKIVSAYEVLKDKNKKKQYDLELNNGNHTFQARRNQEWQNKYYGEAKYYSRSKSSHSSSYSRNGRSKVYNFANIHNNSTFSGRHIDYGNRDDVPHFDYKKHLDKHLKFEQRMLNKHLTEEQIETIIRQLNKDGDSSKVDPEVFTKHLMRQAKLKKQPATTNTYTKTHNPYMYQGTTTEGSGMVRFVGMVSGLGLIILLWKSC